MTYYSVEEDVSEALGTFMLPDDGPAIFTGLYQFKDTLYKTQSIEPGPSLPISEEELRVLVRNFERTYGKDPKIASVLEVTKLKDLLSKLEQVRDQNAKTDVIANEFNVSRINGVTVHFASNICQFWCARCKRLYFEEEVLLDSDFNLYRCPSCRRSLQVTPVWVLRKETGKSPTTPLTVWIRSRGINASDLWEAWKRHRAPPCPKCDGGELNMFYSKNPARLMQSSRVSCSSCRAEFPLFGGNYVLTNATENLTRPFLVSTYNRNYLEIDSRDIMSQIRDSPCFDVSLVERFLYAPTVLVKEIVLGYWYGFRVPMLIKARRFGRDLRTGALFIRLREEYFDRALDYLRVAYSDHPVLGEVYEKLDGNSEDLRRLVLHSLAHALMVQLPSISGISIDTFSYIYDVTNNSVLIYEKAPGGIGACAGLSKEEEESKEPIALEFFTKLRETLMKCTCDDRCKYCIAIRGCREWNDALSRFALGPLLRIDSADLSWGF